MTYDGQMAFRRALMAVGVLVLTACAGSDEAETTLATTTSTTATSTTSTAATTTIAPTTIAPTTVASTTTVDEATILAEIEQAYLDAFWVGKEVLRNPNDPGNEARIREHYTGAALAGTLEDLRRTVEGGYIARENSDSPTFAAVVEPATLISSSTAAEVVVCEFNSDRIYELGTAPGGGDSLRRDDPVSLLIVVRLNQQDGSWKVAGGNRTEEIRGAEERCSDVQPR